MNVTTNLGRAQVLRAVAAWLEKNPTLPIKWLTVLDTGEVEVTPAEDETTGNLREREVQGLYALAEAVGAEVELAPEPYRDGWRLAARWQVGVVPMVAQVHLYEVATDVRPLPAGTTEADTEADLAVAS
ncbi:hypothetical protein TH66_13475 [Carbonactinospora thermoautotrophica]|uniref:Uncharacterized protein n=1 Tax=Carbonactinospora thermoautotrophica TaxID=1469144 RepID=A0A132NK93_9ACTN|nr:hypothetical protein [Carbonactinospora thermoautotrophica]KWX02749.1 hypothetical protein LI90_3795 [Carbonactinospora thermoautotrophica]KWX03790.1 hypothetical protein TH66_13475 [Carbonactinospora thermoautotrophica]KWX10475.1 hypothetical protein TR74_03400 [Carbonactinospora thermoautotrophica]